MIVLITGMMASGKSTVAQSLAMRYSKSVHLRGDVFRKMITGGKVDMSSNHTDEAFEQLRLRYRIAKEVAIQYSDAGFTVIYQDTIIGPVLTDVAELYGEHLHSIIVLNPSVSEIQKRESSRSKTGYTGYTPQQFHEIFQTTPDIGHWIDSSDLSVDSTVDAVMAFIDRDRA